MTDFKIPHGCRLRWLAVFAFAWSVILHSAETESSSWARYFPDRPAAPADETGWAELAKALPNRVKPAIAAAAEALKPPPATRSELRPGIEYVRVRQLAGDLAAIERAVAAPRLIIDLRYVRGELDEALSFGALFARRPLALEGRAAPLEPKGGRVAGQITLCLINRATTGPLEAVLDALQNAGDVLLVGTQSGGDTGHFLPAASAPAWRVIADDYRRANGPSLLDVGVTPGLFVETAADAEDAAYLAFDAGLPVIELLDVPQRKTRFDEARLQQHFAATRPGNGWGPPVPAATPPPDESIEGTDDTPAKKPEVQLDGPPPFDRSLQRAVGTLVAQEVLRGAKLAETAR